MVQSQKWTSELEGILVNFNERDRRTAKELKEKSEAMASWAVEVAGMKKNEALAQKRII